MKSIIQILALSAFALVTSHAAAQFVKGNEAVKVGADGSKQVETPPLPTTGPAAGIKPCKAGDGCKAGPWNMVETAEGLMECTEAFARPGSCRKSTYGATKANRLWVVKSGGNWLKCQFPDLGSKCVSMFAPPPANLPHAAVQ